MKHSIEFKKEKFMIFQWKQDIWMVLQYFNIPFYFYLNIVGIFIIIFLCFWVALLITNIFLVWINISTFLYVNLIILRIHAKYGIAEQYHIVTKHWFFKTIANKFKSIIINLRTPVIEVAVILLRVTKLILRLAKK